MNRAAPVWADATARLGDRLRELGYSPRAVARVFCVPDWNGDVLDTPYWVRHTLDVAPLWDLVEFLALGKPMPSVRVRSLLGDLVWEAEAVEAVGDRVCLNGAILPLSRGYSGERGCDFDLVWTDSPDRAHRADDGLFLPDTSTLAVRRCLPRAPVQRHLDLGAGGGAVTALAALAAQETVALDMNARFVDAVCRTAALNRVSVECVVGDAAAVPVAGPFDRISFVLPLLQAWSGNDALPAHTVAKGSNLLQGVLAQLPSLLADDGLCVLFTQNWVGGGPVRHEIARHMDGAPWTGCYGWFWEDETAVGRLRAGILAIRRGGSGGWVERRWSEEDRSDAWWWPQLAAMLE